MVCQPRILPPQPLVEWGLEDIVVQSLSCVSLWPHGLQHARPPGPSLSPGVRSNPCPSSQCCSLTISSSASPFSSCLQSFWASGSFRTSQFFASGGQSIGTSASASLLPISIQGWFPLKDIHLNYDYFFVHYFYANAALKCLNFHFKLHSWLICVFGKSKP